jgi:beta-glucanase (GH16 family)
MFSKALLLAVAPYLVAGGTPVRYNDFKLDWSDSFEGPAGTSPSTANWDIITGNLGVNNELEVYSSSTQNLRLSGSSTLQIIPLLNDGTWTSGRIESVFVFTPASGVVTRAEAPIRFGNNSISNKQGYWPAFWILGNSIRSGTSWPECGELDILEMIDGKLTGFGTAHCDVFPGGICNEPDGLGATIAVPDQQWHTWRMEWDRTSGDWETETIVWSMDGQDYHTLAGSDIGNETVWETLAHDPLYFILNLAVGGDFVSHTSPLYYVISRTTQLTPSISSPVTRTPRPRTASAA